MKITEKQLLVVFEAFKGTLGVGGDDSIFGFSKETRLQVYQQIVNQQSDKIIDVKDE